MSHAAPAADLPASTFPAGTRFALGGWAALALVIGLVGCSSGSPTASPGHGGGPASAGGGPVSTGSNDPKDIPLPTYITGIVRIFTEAPGFSVFVDGEPALDEKFAVITTPCEISVTKGPHRFIIARDGYRDTVRHITVEKEHDLILEPEASEETDALDGILASAYIDAPLSEAIPLVALNSPGPERDPFLSPDGLTIWFVSERPEGRGIFTATRPTPFHPFDAPVYIPTSRTPDRIATPSATADRLLLAYAVPEKGRIAAMGRTGPEAPFGNPDPIQFSAAGGGWPSAQILGDGLRLYWTEADASGKIVRTMTASRRKADQSFASTAPVSLPGMHPCLSSDGLRQYEFDGKALKRARRASTDVDFSAQEVVASVELPNFTSSPLHRSYAVSEDEQWLVYSDDSEGGDLYMARLVKGRAWGFTPRGRSIAPLVVASREPKEASEDDPEPKKPDVDPRTLPLAYTAHLEVLLALLGERKYDEAERLVQSALTNPAMEADRQLLRWDLDDVRRVQGFWSDVRTTVAGLKPGHPVRIGPTKVDFVRFENDTIHAKAKTKEVAKPLAEMTPSDLSALVDEAKGKDDPVSNLQIGAFLFYDPEGNNRGALGRFERSGNDGAAFVERQAARIVHQAEQEIPRDNAGIALAHVAAVLSAYPSSQAATRAKALEEEVYRQTKWQPIGSRRWPASSEGEYVAAPGRMAGSHLMSTKGYERFELRLEWTTQGSLAQGGVWFRWAGEGSPSSENAFKLHLANDLGQPPDQFSTGALFKVEAPAQNAVLAEGKWNTLMLRVDGEKVTAVVNGKKVLDTTARDKDIPLRGYVALDGEIGGITYRRTLLVELPPEKPAKSN